MNAMRPNIVLDNGKKFTDAPPRAVEEHLRGRAIESLSLETSHMLVVPDGPRLILECRNGRVRQFPMRESCFDKLLRWHHIPSDPITRMGSDTAAHLLNGVLRIINKPVRIRVEDGAALTVTSTEYAEITDLTVLEHCQSDFGAATSVSRSDHFMRIEYDGRVKTEPVVGDVCGLGVEIANSETGFMALQVSAHIYRYVCKNGASAPSAGYKHKMAHYGVTPEALREHLDTGFKMAEGMFASISSRLKRSAGSPASGLDRVARRLDGMLGAGRGKSLIDRFRDQPQEGTQYDLFNLITATAKGHSDWVRLRLETYAGEMLMGNGGVDGA
jgi:hypothetical protein